MALRAILRDDKQMDQLLSQDDDQLATPVRLLFCLPLSARLQQLATPVRLLFCLLLSACLHQLVTPVRWRFACCLPACLMPACLPACLMPAPCCMLLLV